MAAERTVRAVPREHVAGLSERERFNTSTERATRSDAWFCYKFICTRIPQADGPYTAAVQPGKEQNVQGTSKKK